MMIPKAITICGLIHLTLAILLTSFTCLTSAQHPCLNCDVENLVVEPDYRSVKLRWNYFHSPEPLGFRIRFCEVSIWNTKIRCREKKLALTTKKTLESRSFASNPKKDHPMDNLFKVSPSTYEAHIYDLRTLTNYTFSVKPDLSRPFNNRPLFPQFVNHHDERTLATFYDKSLNSNRNRPFSNFLDPLKTVTVETKGFSARTSLCLANVSDVLVNTGPYFSGKVAVENSTDERCAVYGNKSDSKDVYKLTIIHDICGSKIIDNQRIESMIMVHENKEILTHNSRRYLVVCNFVPETYTLKASVDMPPHLLKRKRVEDKLRHSNGGGGGLEESPSNSKASTLAKDSGANHIFLYERYRQNSVRDSRMLEQEQPPESVRTVEERREGFFSNIFTTISVIVGGIGIFVVTLFCYVAIPRLSKKSANSVGQSLSGDQKVPQQRKSQSNHTHRHVHHQHHHNHHHHHNNQYKTSGRQSGSTAPPPRPGSSVTLVVSNSSFGESCA